MTERRTWYIKPKFARQPDGSVTFSSFTWSPEREKWPKYVQVAANDLRDVMQMALADGDISPDTNTTEDA